MPDLRNLEQVLILKLKNMASDHPDRERVVARLAEVQDELSSRDRDRGA